MYFILAGWDGEHGSWTGGMRRASVDPQCPCPALLAFEKVGHLPGLTTEYGKEGDTVPLLASYDADF